MPSTRGGILGGNVDKLSTPTERSDWSVLRTYVIGGQAKRARHYQGCTNSNWWGIYYKYSTLPSGISINIARKVGIFPEAEGLGKYSLPRLYYYRYSTRKGLIFILLHRLSLYKCTKLIEHQSVILDHS